MARVVILSAFASPLRSGAEACAEEVAAALRQHYDISIITARMRSDLPRSDTLPNGVPVLRVGLGNSFDKWLYPFLAPLAARKMHPDLVHAVLESYAGLAMIFCRWMCPKAKRLLTCQSTNTSLLVWLMHWMANGVTAISSALVKRAFRYGRRDVLRIPNGVKLNEFAEELNHERRIEGRLLFVGRLERMKGVDTLIDAFKLLADEFPLAHLRIVGDGSERAALERRAARLVESGRITFAGRVAPGAIAAEYAQAVIFCGLSRSEALGNVFLEAQAAGCAVVATRTGGIPDIVLDAKTGMLVPPHRPDLAAEALRTLLRHPERIEEMGKAGMQNVQRFDWSEIAEQYARVYEGLLR